MGLTLGFALVMAAAVAGPDFSVDAKLPEDFFMGMPKPDDTVQFVKMCPSSLDPQAVERESGWWNACAKSSVLMNQDLDYRAAYLAAAKDPAWSTTGITFKEWSRSSQERKEELRVRLVKVAQGIAAKYNLPTRLEATPVDAALVAEQRRKNEKSLADLLGVTGQPSAKLFEFCPGAANNIHVNPLHPDFNRFQKAISEPSTAALFNSAATAFGEYLDHNSTSSVEEKNSELNRLLAPILKAIH